MERLIKLFILYLFLPLHAKCTYLRFPQTAAAQHSEIECSKRSTRNHWREVHSNGCIETSKKIHQARRMKCLKIAKNAEERAGDMIVDLANTEENKLSDRLTYLASKKLDEKLAEIDQRAEDKIKTLDISCRPENQKISPPEPIDNCIDRKTTEIRAKAENDIKLARIEHKKEMDRSVKLSENKKSQILIDRYVLIYFTFLN